MVLFIKKNFMGGKLAWGFMSLIFIVISLCLLLAQHFFSFFLPEIAWLMIGSLLGVTLVALALFLYKFRHLKGRYNIFYDTCMSSNRACFVLDAQRRVVFSNKQLHVLKEESKEPLLEWMKNSFLQCGQEKDFECLLESLKEHKAYSVDIIFPSKKRWKIFVQPCIKRFSTWIIEDVTCFAQAYESLKDEHQQMESYIQNAPLAMALLGPNGRVLKYNKKFVSLFHESKHKHENEQKYLNDLLLGDSDMQQKTEINKFLQGQFAQIPIEVRFEATPERVNSLYINRFITSKETPLFCVIVIDITDRKSMDLELLQAHKMQAIGQLAGGIAHDFNNLLTAMLGFCDLLLLRHSPRDPSFNDIMQIKQNANRAANLVRQLLAFSRQQTLQPKVINVTDVLAELSALLQRLLGVSIELKMIHGVDLGFVKVDEVQLEQVIINLAVNARDAMSEGGALTIRTSFVDIKKTLRQGHEVMQAGHYVLIEVIDTGTGIEKDNLSRIFEPFFSTKEKGSGTGLGLATVYGIIKQTGGFVFVDSQVGHGTTFRLYFTSHEEVVEVENVEAQKDKPLMADLSGQGTVLLVEDEDAVRLFAAKALRDKGYTVYEASNGEEALKIFEVQKEPIDIFITDVMMAGMDGPAFIKYVRAVDPTTKVIFISGYAEDELRKNLSQFDNIHFLSKPFTLKQLAQKVKEVLLNEDRERLQNSS